MMDNKARIYVPAKSAMQMGRARAQQWVLEFIPREGLHKEPIMNWTGMRDTQPQVRLFFGSKIEACTYAETHHLIYEIIPCHTPTLKPKNYACNFK